MSDSEEDSEQQMISGRHAPLDREHANPRVASLLKSIRESSRKKQRVREEIVGQELKVIVSQLKVTEAQLQKARENTAMLVARLGERQDQIQILEERVRELQMQLNNQSLHKETIVQPAAAISSSRATSSQLTKLELALAEKTREAEVLEQRLKQGSALGVFRADDSLPGNHQSRAMLLLQIGELRSAVERLLYLLKHTSEFNAFISSVEDCPGGPHYLKNICRRMKGNEILVPKILKNHTAQCSCSHPKIDEKYLWAPLDAYRELAEIKRRRNLLDQDCIEEILFALNLVWSAREQSHVKRVREHYEAQLKKKRQRKSTMPFDQLFARKQISRLKKDLSQVRRQKSQHDPARSYETLKQLGVTEDLLRAKQREVAYLTERMHQLEQEAKLADKGLYMGGAAWMGRKVMQELGRHKEMFVSFEDEFCRRLESLSEGETLDWAKLYKWLFQGADQLNNSLYEKIRLMQQAADSKAKHKH